MPSFGAGGAPADGTLAKFSPDLARLHYATYVGGSGHEEVFAIALGAGVVTLAGSTASPDFPATPGSLGSTAGADEGFFLRIDIPAASMSDLGPGWAPQGSPPVLSLTSPPVIGNLTTIMVSGAPPSVTAAIVASLPDSVTLFGGLAPVYVSISAPVLLGGPVTSALGTATLPIPVPADAGLAGLWLHLQAVLLTGSGPFGFSVSNGVVVRAGW